MEYGKKWRLASPFQYLEDNLVFFASYSGNAPYQTNFLGSPHSSKGHIGTQTGGVLYRPGVPRIDGATSKAASFGRATTNMWVNPSIETNTVGYTALLAAVLTRVAGIAEFGAYSLETVTPNVAAGEGWITPTGMAGMAVVAAQPYTFSLYLQGSGTVTQRITWYTAAGAFISNSDQTVTIQSTFTRHCLSATAPALAAFAAVSIITNAIQGITFYSDAIQFENFNYATEYCDGSLGTGYAWTGAAHASTSTRAAAYIDYNNLSTLNNIQQHGTISCWFKTDSMMRSGSHNLLMLIDAGGGLASISARINMGATSDRIIVVWCIGAITCPDGLINYGVYNHLAISYANAYIKVYLNGVLIDTALSLPTAFTGSFSSFRVGADGFGGNFDGRVDDLAIFDRELTEGEIKEIHHYGYSIGLYESDGCNYDPSFVVNSHNKANITHIYIRSNAGVWSNNLMTEPLPFLLQPAVPAVGDAIYFGCDTLALDSGFFSNIIFNYEAFGAQAGSWEYWNGGAWAATVNMVDTTSGLDNSEAGKNSVSWRPSATWAPVLLSAAVAGAPASAPTAYWVRLRFTAVTATPSLELDYYPYSCTWPYFDTCEDSIEGDYEALLKISEKTVYFFNTQSLLIGERILNRGIDFDGFFNCSDEQNSDFVSVNLISASAAFANDAYSTTGRSITYAPGAVAIEEDVFSIRVMNNNYAGTYRLMMFAKLDIASTALFRIELEPYLVGATSYPIAYSQWVSTPVLGINPYYIDMGQITIPEDIGREPTVNGFNLVVHVDKDDLANATWTFYLIMLLPNDELSIEAFDDNCSALGAPSCSSLYTLYIDSAEDQKYTAVSESWNNEDKQGNYRMTSRGEIKAPPREALRFWNRMLANSAKEAYPIHLMKVYLYAAERYIGLRGDR